MCRFTSRWSVNLLERKKKVESHALKGSFDLSLREGLYTPQQEVCLSPSCSLLKRKEALNMQGILLLKKMAQVEKKWTKLANNGRSLPCLMFLIPYQIYRVHITDFFFSPC